MREVTGEKEEEVEEEEEEDILTRCWHVEGAGG